MTSWGLDIIIMSVCEVLVLLYFGVLASHFGTFILL